ncbi:MAG: OsmC family protein [Dehalococcoidia bacterium]
MPAKVIVQSLLDYTHAQLVTAPGRGFIADEPLADDGDDLGPTPYELLAAALGACTSMTIQIYARRKGYPVQEVAVEVEHERVHAKDCADCDSGRDGLIEVLRRRIVIRGEITDEQRADLLRAAGKCPVHKTLMATPEIIDTIEVA